MADVLVVSARQLGHPVASFVPVVTGDRTLHGPSVVIPRVAVSQHYPNRVRTFRVICSICGSRPASPWAQSVDPDVITVEPASVVYAPSTA